jgi:hypothetical protein
MSDGGKMKKNLFTRIATSLLFALAVYGVVSFSLRLHPTSQPVPAWALAEVAAFSKKLGVTMPTVRHADFPGNAIVRCDGDCSVNFGSDFDRAVWSENTPAARALIAHEIGHVWQSSQGKFSAWSREGGLFFAVSFLILLAFPTVPARVSGAVGMIGLGLASHTLRFLAFEQSTLLLLQSFFILGVATASVSGILFLLSRRTDKTQRSLLFAAARVTGLIVGVGIVWFSLRGWAGAEQTQFELEADEIGACLTSPADVVRMNKNSPSWDKYRITPVSHPSPAQRIYAMGAFNRADCPVGIQDSMSEMAPAS